MSSHVNDDAGLTPTTRPSAQLERGAPAVPVVSVRPKPRSLPRRLLPPLTHLPPRRWRCPERSCRAQLPKRSTSQLRLPKPRTAPLTVTMVRTAVVAAAAAAAVAVGVAVPSRMTPVRARSWTLPLEQPTHRVLRPTTARPTTARAQPQIMPTKCLHCPSTLASVRSGTPRSGWPGALTAPAQRRMSTRISTENRKSPSTCSQRRSSRAGAAVGAVGQAVKVEAAIARPPIVSASVIAARPPRAVPVRAGAAVSRRVHRWAVHRRRPCSRSNRRSTVTRGAKCPRTSRSC